MGKEICQSEYTHGGTSSRLGEMRKSAVEAEISIGIDCSQVALASNRRGTL